MPGTMRILNTKVGDVRIAWTEEQAAEMEALIQRKMDQGIRFFIVESNEQAAGEKQLLLPRQPVPGRQVYIGDADIDKMFSDGKVTMFTRIMDGISSIRQALTAREASQSNTLAVRQMGGG